MHVNTTFLNAKHIGVGYNNNTPIPLAGPSGPVPIAYVAVMNSLISSPDRLGSRGRAQVDSDQSHKRKRKEQGGGGTNNYTTQHN